MYSGSDIERMLILYKAETIPQGESIRDFCLRNKVPKQANGWNIQGEHFDSVVFCGNIKDLPQMLNNIDLSGY